MISPYGPVKGRDLNNLRELLGLGVADFIWLFGLSMPAWSALQAKADAPVRDPSVAILARWLDRHPEDCPRASAQIEQLYGRLEGRPQRDLTKKVLGVALGREMSAGYRWLTNQSSYPPIIQRLTYILMERYKSAEQRQLSVDQVISVLKRLARQGGPLLSEQGIGRLREKLENAAGSVPDFPPPLAMVLSFLRKEITKTKKSRSRRITPAILAEFRDRLSAQLPQSTEYAVELERVMTALRPRENAPLDAKVYASVVEELREQASHKAVTDPWDEIVALADIEARARGIADVFATGTWRPARSRTRLPQEK